MQYTIPTLPLKRDIETKKILKQLALSSAALAELKWASGTIPNETILIKTLALQEAKESSEIENIITTHDELFQWDAMSQIFASIESKEVHNYAASLENGFHAIRKNTMLTNNLILQIQEDIEENRAGFRKLPGTELKNDKTGETVYIPPQNYDVIIAHMDNLEQFINNPSLSDLHPLIKMAIIHHQFESIHPFYDGNGRTGRVINVLYLVQEWLLSLPILYLSRYINMHKAQYYSLLQKVRTEGAWEEWILFMLIAVEKTAKQTIHIIENIKKLMQTEKRLMREKCPKIYSQDLLNNLFKHPYTKIEFVMRDVGKTRQTASKYLETLVLLGILEKQKVKTGNYYIHPGLYDLLRNIPDLE
jgi:Fic family protein